MSPSKRQLADAAHERQEDQRALVVVLAAATDFSITMLEWAGADEIAALDAALDRVKASFLKVEVPANAVPSRELPGQLAIDGTVTGEPVTTVIPRELGAPMAEAFDVPKQCPRCGNNMLLVWGGSWTPMISLTPTIFQKGRERALQCGFCAHVELVPVAAYEAVVAERQRTIGASDKSAPKPSRETRTRGAG